MLPLLVLPDFVVCPFASPFVSMDAVWVLMSASASFFPSSSSCLAFTLPDVLLVPLVPVVPPAIAPAKDLLAGDMVNGVEVKVENRFHGTYWERGTDS